MKERIAYDIAIHRLRLAGMTKIAEEVQLYESVDGDLKGWDGWVRGRYAADVIDTIWPPQVTS